MADEQEASSLTPTSGKAMREMREQGMVLPFPSGNYYRIRVLGAAHLLRRGNLPNILLSFVVDAIYTSVNEEKLDAFRKLQDKAETALEFLESLRIVCEEMFLEPRVVADPQADDEVSIADVMLIDQWTAFERAFGLVRELLPFRDQSQADVGSVPVAQDVPQTAK